MSSDLGSTVDFGAVAPIYLAGGLLSIAGAGAIFSVHRAAPEARDAASRLILYVTLTDTAYTLRYVVSAAAYYAGLRSDAASFHLFDDGCASAAAIGQLFACATVLYNACWVANFLMTLWRPLRNTSHLLRWYHAGTWAVSIATAAYTGATVPATATSPCWVRSDTIDSTVFEVPLYAFFSLAAASLVFAGFRLRKGTAATDALRRRLLARHAAYVLAFLVLWTWPILHRFVDQRDQDLPLTLFDAIVVSSQAAVFAAIRLSEPGAWRVFKASLRRGVGGVRLLGRAWLAGVAQEGLLAATLNCPCRRARRSGRAPRRRCLLLRSRRARNGGDTHLTPLLGDDSGLVVAGPGAAATRAARPDSVESYAARYLGAGAGESARNPSLSGPSRRSARLDVLRIEPPGHAPLVVNAVPAAEDSASSSTTAATLTLQAPNSAAGFSVLPSNGVGLGWDVGYGLRMELGACLLSGLCTAVLEADARRAAAASHAAASMAGATAAPAQTDEAGEGADKDIAAASTPVVLPHPPLALPLAASPHHSHRVELEALIKDAPRFPLLETLTPGQAASLQPGAAAALLRGACTADGQHPLVAVAREASLRVGLDAPAYLSRCEAAVMAGVAARAGLVDGWSASVSAIASLSLSTAPLSASVSEGGVAGRLKRVFSASSFPAEGMPAMAQRPALGGEAQHCSSTLLGEPQAPPPPSASGHASSPPPAGDAASYELLSFAEDLFSEVRASCGVTAAEVAAKLDAGLLKSGALKAHFSEGASSSFFCRSADTSLIVKTIAASEVEQLLQLLPAYVSHLLARPESLLCRFYGCFALRAAAGPRVYYVLMGSVFPVADPGPTCRTYDLKGSTVGRKARALASKGSAQAEDGKAAPDVSMDSNTLLVLGTPTAETQLAPASPRAGWQPPGAPGLLLQDQDFRGHFQGGLAVFGPGGAARGAAIAAALDADAALLRGAGLMDYSLMLSLVPAAKGGLSEAEVEGLPHTVDNLAAVARVVGGLSFGKAPEVAPQAAAALVAASAEAACCVGVKEGHVFRRDVARVFSISDIASSGGRRIPRWSPLAVNAVGVPVAGVQASALVPPPWLQPHSDGAASFASAAGYGILQAGVIDVLQAFDIGKRMEHAFKSLRFAVSSIVGGGGGGGGGGVHGESLPSPSAAAVGHLGVASPVSFSGLSNVRPPLRGVGSSSSLSGLAQAGGGGGGIVGHGADISAVDPDRYAARFSAFVGGVFSGERS